MSIMIRPFKTSLNWLTGAVKISVLSQCQEDSREKELPIEIQSFYLKHNGIDLVKQPVWLKSNKELHYNFLQDSTSGEG